MERQNELTELALITINVCVFLNASAKILALFHKNK